MVQFRMAKVPSRICQPFSFPAFSVLKKQAWKLLELLWVNCPRASAALIWVTMTFSRVPKPIIAVPGQYMEAKVE